LGFVVSVLALFSLLARAFQGALQPYPYGVMGGVLDVYRTLRDELFSGLGNIFSGLKKLMGHWPNWLRHWGFVKRYIHLVRNGHVVLFSKYEQSRDCSSVAVVTRWKVEGVGFANAYLQYAAFFRNFIRGRNARLHQIGWFIEISKVLSGGIVFL